MVIAIDGPAASGKSSTANAVAAALGFRHVDSGALYRALTAVRARRGGASTSWTESEVLACAESITLAATPGGFEARVEQAPIGEELRSAVVTGAVSTVAQMPGAREWVNTQVRAAGEAHNVVVDGRDIGTAVFPDAELKIYLVADSWERARRRLLQRIKREPADAEVADEVVAIESRDAKDAVQSVQARDAFVIDTSNITQAEQIAHIVALAHTRRKPA